MNKSQTLTMESKPKQPRALQELHSHINLRVGDKGRNGSNPRKESPQFCLSLKDKGLSSRSGKVCYYKFWQLYKVKFPAALRKKLP